ncbi:MAG: hypothetical protein ACOC16_00495 [Nanoarchaeota archaeon]
MQQEVKEIIEILTNLIEDAPFKAKLQIEIIIKMFDNELTQDNLIKIQDNLEYLSNIPSIDSYTRNEVYNILSIIEGFL